MKPLRILVAHNVPRARNGGMSRIMGFIHDRLEQAGHCVDYFCAEDLPPRYRGRLARFAFPWLVYRRAVAAAKAKTPYDLVNVHEPNAAVISSRKKSAGNPLVVVTSHGIERRSWELAIEELRLKRAGPSAWTRLVFPLTSLWQSNWGLRRADHILCLNDEDRDYLVRWFGRKPDEITRIFPAADPIYATAAADRDYTRAERLLFPATWRKNKGIEDLVPAFGQLAARHPRLTLTVLGGGISESTVQACFPEEIRPRIGSVQALDERQNAAAYAEHDLFLMPSLFEGTPLTLIEGMASGLPIVTTATCGMKDVIGDRVNGLLVPIRSPAAIVEAVQSLLEDPALRSRLGRQARQDMQQRYTWDRVAAPVVELYETLCRNRPHGT